MLFTPSYTVVPSALMTKVAPDSSDDDAQAASTAAPVMVRITSCTPRLRGVVSTPILVQLFISMSPSENLLHQLYKKALRRGPLPLPVTYGGAPTGGAVQAGQTPPFGWGS